MTPTDLAADIQRLARDLPGAIEAAVNTTVDYADQQAKRYSSGGTSAAQLAREDHPYATRHGSPRRDPTVINIQRARLLREWVKVPARRRGGAIEGSVYNTSPEAALLDTGTRFMFRRPLAERVVGELEPVLRRELASEIGKVMR